jgi:hypothetical protein
MSKKNSKNEKNEKKSKVEKSEKAAVRTKFGHLLSTMSGMIDNLVLAGTSLKAAEKAIKKFNKDCANAERKFKLHVAHLIKDKNVKVVIKGDVYKAK